MNDRYAVAKFTFSVGAVLGILVIGGACLYAAAYNPHASVLMTFVKIFMPLSVLWSLFSYGAYKGLTSRNAVLKFVFWFYVVCNVFTFPVGTAVAGVSIWLWRDLRKDNA